MDISPLSNLTNLVQLDLSENNILDISPLIENLGINKGDSIDISYNPLNLKSIETYVPELESRGVELIWEPVIETSVTTPPPEEKAILSIDSNPNASLYINDSYIGTTPFTLKLEKGKYTIRIEKEGYITYTETIELFSGEKKNMFVYLNKVTNHSLYIGIFVVMIVSILAIYYITKKKK